MYYFKKILYFIWIFFVKVPLQVLWGLFTGPGQIFISLSYLFPKEWGKGRNVTKTSRDKKNIGIMAPIYSFIFYFGLIFLFF